MVPIRLLLADDNADFRAPGPGNVQNLLPYPQINGAVIYEERGIRRVRTAADVPPNSLAVFLPRLA